MEAPAGPAKRPPQAFYYLGRSGTTHLWLHLAPSASREESFWPAETAELCGQVYNTMLHHALAATDEACLVFSVAGTDVLPVCVRHALRGSAPLELRGRDLAETLKLALEADRPSAEEFWTVLSPEAPGAPYKLYKIPGGAAAALVADLKRYSLAPFTATEVVEVLSVKPTQ